MLKTKYSAAMWATSILALVSALGTFFALLYFNFLHAILDKWTIAVVLAGPAAAVAVLIYAAIKIFKKRENAFFIPSFLAIIGCTLVFFLADSASLSKIETDYLKHETDFSHTVAALKEEYITVSDGSLLIQEGTFPLENAALESTVPEKRVQIIKIDDFHTIFYFIALDTDNRTEGYVYVPDELYPREWDDAASWSEPLDINSKWWYICLYK